MALLRLSNGTVYTTHEDIAPLIGAMTIGYFDYPEDAKRKIAKIALPPTEEEERLIFDSVDPKALKALETEGIRHRRLGVIAAPKNDGAGFFLAFGPSIKEAHISDKADMSKLRVHANSVNECHFVMSGAITKGIELGDGLQGVLYLLPGEWMRLNDKCVVWSIVSYGEPTVGVSYFDQPPGTFETKDFPEVEIKPEMSF